METERLARVRLCEIVEFLMRLLWSGGGRAAWCGHGQSQMRSRVRISGVETVFKCS